MPKKTKRLVSLFLTSLLILNLTFAIDFPIYADSTKTYNYEHFSIDYTVKTEWENSQEICVIIRNTSEEPLRGWAFEFDAGGDVKNVFGAEVYDNDETTYILKSTTDNNTIEPGETASFSYTVFGSNISEPRAFRLVSKRVVLTDGYSVNIKSNANNKAKFDGSISIKNTQKNTNGNNGKNNTGKNVIDAWTVSFDANFTLENVNRGTFTVDENGRYTITGTGIVSIIRPNVSVQLDISGTKTPNVKPAISNVVVTSVKIDNTINEEEENSNITDITLEAWAQYYENALTLLWASSINDGNFIIYVSDNGTDFTELTTVENTNSYVYTQSFTKKYFKIVQKYDSITVESPIITAEKTSDGYVDLSYYDTDGDGLSDYEESILLTDKTKPDTDTDGLTDYEEVYLTGTDPLVYDSVTPGISDSQADIDNDSLTHRDEVDRGTNPVDSDSDYDTLNDGEEVNTYGTDPIKFDTDGDNVSDSDELQLGLNPTATSY
jgi:hypothetical protein